MPQCIAQQDQSAWLGAMTANTWNRCTRHFGIICTRHQYQIQLSGLRASFSPELVDGYLAYCSRSVLAKAQLYQWILRITGRAWLVEVGDSIDSQSLSPSSLPAGYEDLGVTQKAPTCLLSAGSAMSEESFTHTMASCSFTSMPRHTGDATRPWEYNHNLGSIVALDYETAAYTLTQHSLIYGDYFDKACFCSIFAIDVAQEPCLASQELDLTKERLWMNATCGSRSLTAGWADGLQTTKSAYIPAKIWSWPKCIRDVPEKVLERTERCTTNACDLDSSGYCEITRAVKRACFCRAITYETCKGSCHVFEKRIDYVKWLYDYCGDVKDWHGLPKDWYTLASPTAEDMIPWRWAIEHFKTPSRKDPGHTCSSSGDLRTNLVILNAATFFGAVFTWRFIVEENLRSNAPGLHMWSWITTGTLASAAQGLAYWLSACLITSTTGFSHIPIGQLVLILCSMPRPAWIKAMFLSLQNPESVGLYAAASTLFGEFIMQIPAWYYMFMTVRYGYAHSFYSRSMERLSEISSAMYMYTGAAIWLICSLVAVVQYMRIVCKRVVSDRDYSDLNRIERRQTLCEELKASLNKMIAPVNAWYGELEDAILHRWSKNFLESRPAARAMSQPVYGTICVVSQGYYRTSRLFVRLYLVAILSSPVLWIAQCLFWVGFLGLSRAWYVLGNRLVVI